MAVPEYVYDAIDGDALEAQQRAQQSGMTPESFYSSYRSGVPERKLAPEFYAQANAPTPQQAKSNASQSEQLKAYLRNQYRSDPVEPAPLTPRDEALLAASGFDETLLEPSQSQAQEQAYFRGLGALQRRSGAGLSPSVARATEAYRARISSDGGGIAGAPRRMTRTNPNDLHETPAGPNTWDDFATRWGVEGDVKEADKQEFLKKWGSRLPPEELPPEPVQLSPEEQRAAQEQANTAEFSADYLRGNQRVVPEHVGLGGEQWAQQNRVPMVGRTPRETAENAARWGAARDEVLDRENDMLVDRRLNEQARGDREAMTQRGEYAFGRGMADQYARLKEDEDRRRKIADDHAARMERLLDESIRLDKREPLKEYWSNRTGGQRVVDAISIGLGAIGSALTGAPNFAMQIINSEIESRIATHMANRDSLGARVNHERAVFGDLMSQFLSPEAAQNAMRSTYSGILESFYRQQAASERNQESQLALNAVADELGLQRERQAQAALEGDHQLIMKRIPAQTVGFPGGIRGYQRMARDLGLTPEETRDGALALVKGGNDALAQYLNNIGADAGLDGGMNLPMDRNERSAALEARERQVSIPWMNRPVYHGRKRDAGEREKAANGIMMMDQELQKLEELAKRRSTTPWVRDPNVTAEVEAIGANINNYLRVMFEQGIQQEKEYERNKKFTGEAILKLSRTADPRFDKLQFIRDLRRHLVEPTKAAIEVGLSYDAMGKHPVRPGLRRTK